MTVNVKNVAFPAHYGAKATPSHYPTAPSSHPAYKKLFATINTLNSPIPSIDPSESYRVLGVDLNTTLTFTKHSQKLKRTTTSPINAVSTSLGARVVYLLPVHGSALKERANTACAASPRAVFLFGRYTALEPGNVIGRPGKPIFSVKGSREPWTLSYSLKGFYAYCWTRPHLFCRPFIIQPIIHVMI
jgi:hypothetical protein